MKKTLCILLTFPLAFYIFFLIPNWNNVKIVNNDSTVINHNLYPEFEVKQLTGRGNHDLTFINNDLVSFNKPSDGNSYFINTDTWEVESEKFINFTDNDCVGTPRELEMKSCDYKYGKLLVGNGRAIKYDETSYTQQCARLYVFYNSDAWKYSESPEITYDNCGEYDVIDVTELGYKIYGFWGQFDDCIFVSCNLFNDIYLIQLGKGSNNLGQGEYKKDTPPDRYNGSYMVIDNWHQDKGLDDWAGHGGQFYKGNLYIATNNPDLCTIYKCILNQNGKLEFEALNFDVKDATGALIQYRYIDGLCIKDDIIYAQPLYQGTSEYWHQNYNLIVGKI